MLGDGLEVGLALVEYVPAGAVLHEVGEVGVSRGVSWLVEDPGRVRRLNGQVEGHCRTVKR